MGFNDWNELAARYPPWAGGVNESVVLSVAKAIVSLGLRDAGYTYINLDCGYSKGKTNSGKLLEVDDSKFPSGLPSLSKQITDMGLAFGIYSSGTHCCDGNVRLGMEQSDAKTFAGWNVTYVKYDDCGTTTESFTAMRVALKATAGPMYYSIHSPWTHKPTTGTKYGPDPAHSVDLANCWRTTNDIKNNFSVVLDRAHTNDAFAHLSVPGHHNDPDMLEVGNGLTDPEGRTHFALWCLMKAPLLIGTDITRASAATVATLGNRRAIAVNQDSLGIQGRFVTSGDNWELWAGPLSGACVAAVFVNTGSSTVSRDLSWAELGIKAGTPMSVVDVYSNTTRPGRSTGSVAVTVATEHDCAFLTLCP